MSLSHINESNQASMVDISGKPVTVRHAVAEARITVNESVAAQFQGGEFVSKKGPVFQTAILAGVMGAKQTPHLIPLCHPLPLDDCQITAEFTGNEAVLRCSCKTTGRTGVEMEALTGVTIAALTVFDMIKALDKTAVIHSVRVIEKTGGTSDILPANT